MEYTNDYSNMCNTSSDSVALIVGQFKNEVKAQSRVTFKQSVIQWLKEIKVSKIKKYIFYFLIVVISCSLVYLIYHKDSFNRVSNTKQKQLNKIQQLHTIKIHKKGSTPYERSTRYYDSANRGAYYKNEL